MSTKPPSITEEFDTPKLKALRDKAKKKEQEKQKTLREIARIESKERDKRTKLKEHQQFILGGDLRKRTDEEQDYKGIPFQEIMDFMITNLERDQDRKAFGLKPLPKNQNSPSKEMKKATA
jgi:hypothetical protein